MTLLVWSIILGGLNLLAVWLVGDKRRRGFLAFIAADMLWVIYAAKTGQWGFVPECFIFAAMHIRNYRKWAAT